LKFSLKKRIISNIKNRHKKFQDISLEHKPSSQEDNEGNKGEIKNTTYNNTVEIKKAEFLGNSSGLEAHEELQISNGSKKEEVEEGVICHHCKEKIDEEWKEPHWKWNLDKNIKFCMKCYGTKEIEYEKLMNYCVVCSSKLKFIRYNPKPEWKLRGQLCRMCWDSQNRKYKGDKKILGIS
jgi:hypothetical protein